MPQLAPTVDKLEDVPEPARPFYVQKDGKFALDLSAAPSGFASVADLAAANAKVVEFRDNNVSLKRTVDELLPLKAKFEGIDPEAAKVALAAQEALKKRGVTKPDDIATIVDAAVEAAVQSVVKPLTEQIASISSTAKETQARADAMMLRATLSETFTKSGGVPEAFDFVAHKAAGVFVVDGNTVKAAPTQFSQDKPGEPLSVTEWMTRLAKESSFLFKPSSGSGANPTPTGGGPTRPAGQIVLRDPTPQQLGAHAKDIATGKMRIECTQ